MSISNFLLSLTCQQEEHKHVETSQMSILSHTCPKGQKIGKKLTSKQKSFQLVKTNRALEIDNHLKIWIKAIWLSDSESMNVKNSHISHIFFVTPTNGRINFLNQISVWSCFRILTASCLCNIYFTLELSVRLRYRGQCKPIAINTSRLIVVVSIIIVVVSIIIRAESRVRIIVRIISTVALVSQSCRVADIFHWFPR